MSITVMTDTALHKKHLHLTILQNENMRNSKEVYFSKDNTADVSNSMVG